MYSFDAAAYKGIDQKDERVGHIATEAFFCVASGKNEVTAEQLDTFLNNVKYRLTSERIAYLKDLEQLIDEELNQVSGKDLSLSAAFSIDEVVYLVTRGKAGVNIFRGGMLQKLIEGNKIASGQLQQGDTLILTTEHFFKEVDEGKLTTILSDNTPAKLIELLKPELEKVTNVPLVAYFIRAYQQAATSFVDQSNLNQPHADDSSLDEHHSDEAFLARPATEQLPTAERQPVEETYIEDMTKSGGLEETQEAGEAETFAPRAREQSDAKGKKLLSIPFNFKFPPVSILNIPSLRSSSKGKKITLVITVILLVVFLWSVVLGNSRRQKSKFIEEVQKADQVVNEKLSLADDVRIEDPVKALQLVDEASALYSELAKKAEEKKYTDIEQLSVIAGNIKDARQGIQKTEQSPADEFYDLSLIRSGAKAQKLYLDGDQLAMLDSTNGRVYVLAVDSKSVDTISNKDFKDARFVGLHQGNPIVFKSGTGVIKFSDEKAEKIIDNDKDWKGIKDMGLFRGNIYLLAEGNDEVYKYLVAENGYGDKTSYFKTGQSEELTGAEALSIDAAVYIAKDDEVLKYISGLKEAFDIAVPEEESTFSDIYTSASLENIYVMDKDNATIFIFSKDGEFQKQVASAVIAKADDFVVNQEEGILVLSNNKIYQIKQNN